MEPHDPKSAAHIAMDAVMRDPETVQALRELKAKKSEKARNRKARRSARKRDAAAQPTCSSNDMNSDDKCEVFARPGLAMAKKRQFKVEKTPRTRKPRNTVTDDLAELLATTSFATESTKDRKGKQGRKGTQGQKGLAVRWLMRRIDKKLVHEKRTHSMRAGQAEPRPHLGTTQKTNNDGRDASDSALDGREGMVCDEL